MRKRLLALYPSAWRERYGEEMAALLEESTPNLAATLDLALGALRAHLRPLTPARAPERARNSISGVLGCFILLCLLGSAFAKTTENFDQANNRHALLGVSHSAVLIAALVAGGALVIAAVPLTLAALGQARRTRSPKLIKLLGVPVLAIAALILALALLVLWLRGGHRSHVGVIGWGLFGLVQVVAIGAAAACWLAPRAILRHIEVPRDAFRLALPAVAIVALGMVAVTVATGLYLSGVIVDAPAVGAMGNGPGQLISVSASIAFQFAGMVVLSAAALLSTWHGLGALREV